MIKEEKLQKPSRISNEPPGVPPGSLGVDLAAAFGPAVGYWQNATQWQGTPYTVPLNQNGYLNNFELNQLAAAYGSYEGAKFENL